MENDQDLEDTSEIGGTGEQPPHEALIANDVSPDGLNVGPLQIRFWEITEIVDTNTSIIFNVPQSDGMHQVWIDYHGPDGYFQQLLVGAWYKGMQWNVLHAYALPEGNGFYRTQWAYKSNWSEVRDKPVLVRKLPQITGVDSSTGTVSATGVSTGGHFSIVKQYTDEAMSLVVPATQADWSINLLSSVKPGTYSIHVRHTITGEPARWSAPVTLKYYGVPSFSHLNDNDVIRVPKPQLQGVGFPGATVKIFESMSGVIVYGTALVDPYGQWSTVLTESLPERPFVFTANQSLDGSALPGWAVDVPVYVNFRPTISADSATEQAQTFTLTGSDGLVGGTVEVFHDGRDTKYGTSAVLTREQWSASVFVPPGPLSLVAVNVGVEHRSGRSSPRGFKIRPARIIAVDVELIDTSVKFSGTGHPGATVVITVPGSSIKPPPPVVAHPTTGIWTTTATDWPYGTGTAQIIQKVGDGASGWIESLPFSFPVNRVLPDVSDVTSTSDYKPIVRGKGSNGATVQLLFTSGGATGLPDAVVTNGQWSSTAATEWGPMRAGVIHIRQSRDGQYSPNWIAHTITIPPLAPGLNDPVEDGLFPKLSGSCWPGAKVKLKFSDEVDVVHDGDVVAGIWTFQRKTPFAEDTEHTVTVTQFVAEQLSPEQSKKFTVTATLLKPEITGARPDLANGMGRNMIIEGEQGVNGASMQIYDAQYGDKLGLPETLSTEDGRWRLTLTGLDLRIYYIKAQQSFGERDSDVSDWYDFEVKLLPPCITVPKPDEKRVRTSMIEGRGIPTGRVSVWLQDDDKPLLDNIVVDEKGSWETLVTLPVGTKTIYARQTFVHEGQTYTSEESSPLSYCVVPAAPYIETPVEGGDIGQRVVVAGYGIPGDSVTVIDDSLTPLGTSVVREDRTWWVSVTLDQPGGIYTLNAVAALEGFESAGARRSVRLGAYLPSIDVPAFGRRVSVPVQFAGQGLAGIGQVQSWFDPEQLWAQAIPVDEQGWETVVTQPMREGGHWCRFRQTLSDGEPGAISGVFTSQRFEVEPGTPKKS